MAFQVESCNRTLSRVRGFGALSIRFGLCLAEEFDQWKLPAGNDVGYFQLIFPEKLYR